MKVEKHMRWFIMAALIYLLAGALLGIGLRFTPTLYYLRFVHVHLMLLGFMAMMVYGIGYFIIPRFNGAALKWPGAVVAHFWIANVGLWGMVVAYSFHAATGSSIWNGMFIGFSSLQVLSIGMFVFNLVFTLKGAQVAQSPAAHAVQPQSAQAPPEPVKIRGDMPVGDIIDKWPAARQILADSGLSAVADDDHLEHIKQAGVPLRMACMRHGIDLNTLINKLTKGLNGEGDVQAAQPAAKKIEAPIVSEHIIGDVMASFPETIEIFKRYYGDGCFDCPGQSMETVAMSANIHNLDEQEVLDALNEIIGAAK
jgi:hybrid cluster-associated redox disulfide protein